MSKNEDILIIGAGFAGLAAGIYARLNGYRTRIFEMHDKPGGLCTSWKRKGYTFDGCIHWLVGSSPESGIHDLWEDTGIAKDLKIKNHEEYCRLEDLHGRTLILYTDVDRLEKHLLEFSPADRKPIKKFIAGIRMCISFDSPSRHDSFITRMLKQARTAGTFIMNAGKMRYWMKTTCEGFSKKFSDPLLRQAFLEMWVPEFSMLFMLFTFGYLHRKNAGYPAGGSMPMSEAMEARYRQLGGEIVYRSKVTKILTSEDNATGIKLEDGTVHSAGRVISASDGYNTLYNLLEGKFGDNTTFEPYEKWPVFPSLIFVSLGINRTFTEVPETVSGIAFNLKMPVLIADSVRESLTFHLFNHDHSMAPEGKTAMTLMLASDYYYWKNLAMNRAEYNRIKEETGKKIIEQLEQRFPGITEQVEVIDIATPLTFERYTGNWKGCFEGWLMTPENANVLMKPMPQTVPGLNNFYMCGQWVEPGGGLPTSVMSARRLIKSICREDRKTFTS